MKRLIWILSLPALMSCTGCTETSNLPKASGLSGDMYLVMDSAQWKGPLGHVMDSLFSQEMPGLPRDEAIFRMRWIDPRKLNLILKQRRNLVFAVTLDQHGSGAQVVKRIFTPGSLEKIKSDPKLFIQTSSNLFAKGQEVMFLFGNTEAELVANVRKNGAKFVEFFDKTERERLTAALFRSGRPKGVSEWLVKNFQCNLLVPFGYKLVQNEHDFLWVRQINPKVDKDIFIARANYNSQDQFTKENLIRFRDEICKKYLFEDPDRGDSYLVTETAIPFIPVMSRELNFNEHYAVELRGLWRTNNKSMGGPFLGYAMVDEPAGKFYYIEGFTFSPGKEQREIIRELETILFTFELSDKVIAKK